MLVISTVTLTIATLPLTVRALKERIGDFVSVIATVISASRPVLSSASICSSLRYSPAGLLVSHETPIKRF